MDARNEPPQPRDARHSEASTHCPRCTEWRLENEGAGCIARGELRCYGAAERVTVQDDVGVRDAKPARQEVQGRVGVERRAGVRRPARYSIVAAIFGQENAAIGLAREACGPWNEPARHVSIAVKGDYRGSGRPAIPDEETEELDTVGGAVRDAFGRHRPVAHGAGRLEENPFLVSPEHDQEPDVGERHSGSD
jgi:hypothetical protein